MSQRTIEIGKLFSAVGLDHDGSIVVTENMSGLEPNPKDDWLYMGLEAMSILMRRGFDPGSAAMIGSGNGIDAIAALKLFPTLNTLYVTDVLPEILPNIVSNVSRNVPGLEGRVNLISRSGRDCGPVPEEVGFVYGNLPLIAADAEEIRSYGLGTTTLTDAEAYAHLDRGKGDILTKWSLLSQLGFLLSAKEKLQSDGKIITLIGGRYLLKRLRSVLNGLV